MKKKIVLLVFTLGLAVVVFFLIDLNFDQQINSTSQTQSIGDNTSVDVKIIVPNKQISDGAVTNNRNLAFKEIALPPQNTGLADHLYALKIAAEKGSTGAACRLGFELDRCLMESGLKAAISSLNEKSSLIDASNPRKERLETMLGNLKSDYEVVQKVCKGISSTEFNSGWKYALQASNDGHLPSMIRYVRQISAGLDLNNMLATPEGWVEYKERAPIFLQQAIDRGSAEAYEYAGFMHLRRNEEWRLVPYDIVKGLSYYYALNEVAALNYKDALHRNISHFIADRKFTNDQIDAAKSLSIPLAKSLREKNTAPIDFSKGTQLSGDASYCGQN